MQAHTRAHQMYEPGKLVHRTGTGTRHSKFLVYRPYLPLQSCFQPQSQRPNGTQPEDGPTPGPPPSGRCSHSQSKQTRIKAAVIALSMTR